MGKQSRDRNRESEGPGLRHFFSSQPPEPASTPSKMAAPPRKAARPQHNKEVPSQPPSRSASPPASPGSSHDPFTAANPPGSTAIMESSAPGHLLQSDLQRALSQLPSKEDFTALASRVEAAVREDIHSLQQTTALLAGRVEEITSQLKTVAPRLQALEADRDDTIHHLRGIQLRLEDLEDRSRRNNIRIRGLPEATLPAHLKDTVRGLLSSLLEETAAQDIIIDRVHRALGPRPMDSLRPRDVICKLHYYETKEEIIRKAWQQRPFMFDGASLHILPDLSRNTLRRRALLKPLLDKIRNAGATYRWGYPLHLIVHKDNRNFSIHSPDDVSQVLEELGISPFPLANWLLHLPDGGQGREPGPRARPDPSSSRSLPPAGPSRAGGRRATSAEP